MPSMAAKTVEQAEKRAHPWGLDNFFLRKLTKTMLDHNTIDATAHIREFLGVNKSSTMKA